MRRARAKTMQAAAIVSIMATACSLTTGEVLPDGQVDVAVETNDAGSPTPAPEHDEGTATSEDDPATTEREPEPNPKANEPELPDPPADEDNDEVEDSQDSCPQTVGGSTVDQHGCAAEQLDNDADGINDAADQCPDTHDGDEVDEYGCALPQPCQTAEQVITPAAMQVWAVNHLGGDKNFSSSESLLYAEVRSDWRSEQELRLQLYFHIIEDGPNWTQGSGTTGWVTAFTAPSGMRIVGVTARGQDVLKDGIGSPGARWGQVDGRGGVFDNTTTASGKLVAEGTWTRDTDHSAELQTGQLLVDEWRFIGDTEDDDIGNNKGDQDANVKVTFEPVTVTLQETGDCTA